MVIPKFNNKFIIRDFKSDDYEDIIDLWNLTNLGNPLRGDDKQTIEESIRLGGSLLVTEDNNTGKICGTSWMTYDGRRMHLHHFGILPDYQGLGLAETLLKESLARVKRNGHQVKLEVHKSNERAIKLYKKHGFESLGDYEIYIIRDISKI
jgi:[ribosomal protein S18]-alanine N-acetyltransferase